VVERPSRPTRKPASARTAAAKGSAKSSAGAKPTSRPKPKTKRKRKADTGRRKATARAALGSVVLVGLLFAFVYPTRTFLDQRADTSRARAQLELLHTENERLAQEAKKLKSDTEIERRGRAYGLVKPGERPFVIIPEPTTTLPAGTASPAP
jgi:cell division protein FtsB